MSQTGGLASRARTRTLDTNCQISSFPAGATATFTASAVADQASATIGETLNARFFVFLGGATSGVCTAARSRACRSSRRHRHRRRRPGTRLSVPHRSRRRRRRGASAPRPASTSCDRLHVASTDDDDRTRRRPSRLRPSACVAAPGSRSPRPGAGRRRHCELAVQLHASKTRAEGQITRQTPRRGTRMTPARDDPRRRQPRPPLALRSAPCARTSAASTRGSRGTSTCSRPAGC